VFLISLNCQNWPPNSSYGLLLFWGALWQLVYRYRQKFKNIDHLKQVLNSCWDMNSQELINCAIGPWSKRLLLVVHSHGGHTVICACCKLVLSRTALQILSAFTIFWVVHSSCAKQRIFNSTVRALFFSCVVKRFLNISVKTVWLGNSRCVKVCAFFFLEHPVAVGYWPTTN